MSWQEPSTSLIHAVPAAGMPTSHHRYITPVKRETPKKILVDPGTSPGRYEPSACSRTPRRRHGEQKVTGSSAERRPQVRSERPKELQRNYSRPWAEDMSKYLRPKGSNHQTLRWQPPTTKAELEIHSERMRTAPPIPSVHYEISSKTPSNCSRNTSRTQSRASMARQHAWLPHPTHKEVKLERHTPTPSSRRNRSTNPNVSQDSTKADNTRSASRDLKPFAPSNSYIQPHIQGHGEKMSVFDRLSTPRFFPTSYRVRRRSQSEDENCNQKSPARHMHRPQPRKTTDVNDQSKHVPKRDQNEPASKSQQPPTQSKKPSVFERLTNPLLFPTSHLRKYKEGLRRRAKIDAKLAMSKESHHSFHVPPSYGIPDIKTENTASVSTASTPKSTSTPNRGGVLSRFRPRFSRPGKKSTAPMSSADVMHTDSDQEKRFANENKSGFQSFSSVIVPPPPPEAWASAENNQTTTFQLVNGLSANEENYHQGKDESETKLQRLQQRHESDQTGKSIRGKGIPRRLPIPSGTVELEEPPATDRDVLETTDIQYSKQKDALSSTSSGTRLSRPASTSSLADINRARFEERMAKEKQLQEEKARKTLEKQQMQRQLSLPTRRSAAAEAAELRAREQVRMALGNRFCEKTSSQKHIGLDDHEFDATLATTNVHPLQFQSRSDTSSPTTSKFLLHDNGTDQRPASSSEKQASDNGVLHHEDSEKPYLLNTTALKYLVDGDVDVSKNEDMGINHEQDEDIALLAESSDEEIDVDDDGNSEVDFLNLHSSVDGTQSLVEQRANDIIEARRKQFAASLGAEENTSSVTPGKTINELPKERIKSSCEHLNVETDDTPADEPVDTKQQDQPLHLQQPNKEYEENSNFEDNHDQSSSITNHLDSSIILPVTQIEDKSKDMPHNLAARNRADAIIDAQIQRVSENSCILPVSTASLDLYPQSPQKKDALEDVFTQADVTMDNEDTSLLSDDDEYTGTHQQSLISEVPECNSHEQTAEDIAERHFDNAVEQVSQNLADESGRQNDRLQPSHDKKCIEKDNRTSPSKSTDPSMSQQRSTEDTFQGNTNDDVDYVTADIKNMSQNSVGNGDSLNVSSQSDGKNQQSKTLQHVLADARERRLRRNAPIQNQTTNEENTQHSMSSPVNVEKTEGLVKTHEKQSEPAQLPFTQADELQAKHTPLYSAARHEYLGTKAYLPPNTASPMPTSDSSESEHVRSGQLVDDSPESMDMSTTSPFQISQESTKEERSENFARKASAILSPRLPRASHTVSNNNASSKVDRLLAEARKRRESRQKQDSRQSPTHDPHSVDGRGSISERRLESLLADARRQRATKQTNQDNSMHTISLIKEASGLGMVIDNLPSPDTPYNIRVKSLLEDGAAHTAGLLVGDRLVLVNGTNVRGKSKQEMISYFKDLPQQSVSDMSYL